MQTSLHARESKTVLDSGIHPLYPGFKVMDSAFQSIVRFRIPWFVFRIPDSRIHKQTFPRFRNPDSLEASPHVSESETVLDSGFLAVYSRFQILDSIFFVRGLGFRITIVSGILYSLSCIPGSKAQDSGFHKSNFPDSWLHKQNFPGFPNPDSLTWGERQVLAF